MAEKAMQKRYYYTDVHVHGVYPRGILSHWKRKGFSIDCTPEDLAALKEGCVDYIGFSYYMSFAVKATYISSISFLTSSVASAGWQGQAVFHQRLPL